MARLYPAAFAFLLLLLPPASAAEGDASMINFCRNLLNISEVQQNATVPANASNGTINASITFSRDYYTAQSDLAAANASVEKMKNAGFPYMRSRDIYMIAQQWFEGQEALEKTGERGDYGFVFEKTAEVKALERQAFAVSDDLRALSTRFRQAGGDVNISEAVALQRQAQAEFDDSRFEEAQQLINTAYDKVTNAEAEATRRSALLESARRSAEAFLQENWQKILMIAAAASLFFFLFQKQIRRFLVSSKIRALTAERGVLEGMIRQLQRDYFDSGKVNEMSYHIKTKKFGDLIRNINRQLPLLKEELKRL